MAKFGRNTLVIDNDEIRPQYGQILENLLGFPQGIAMRDLRGHGRRQAEHFGAHFSRTTVSAIQRQSGGFKLSIPSGDVESKTLILCAGVTDRWPAISSIERFVGRSLFSCVRCDGHRGHGKTVVAFGHDQKAADIACQMTTFAEKITFVAAPGDEAGSLENQDKLRAEGIEFVEGEPASVEGVPTAVTAVFMKDGRRIPCQIIYCLYGATPNNKLALDVGATTTARGYVVVDDEGATNVPGFFCAGDLSHPHAHLVCTAMFEGAEAAMAANYFLFAGHCPTETARQVLNLY